MKRRAFLINTTLATAGGLTILSFPSLGKTITQTKVIHAGLVAPTILGITIKDGTFIRGGQKPYVEQTGDEVFDKNRWPFRLVSLPKNKNKVLELAN